MVLFDVIEGGKNQAVKESRISSWDVGGGTRRSLGCLRPAALASALWALPPWGALVMNLLPLPALPTLSAQDLLQ